MAQWAAVPYRGVERAKERGYHLVNRMIGPLRPQARNEWAALSEGLFATPAAIPPKYFYDGLGCALFEAICELDRKSTRLNSSHTVTSYAVFCLKKKKP